MRGRKKPKETPGIREIKNHGRQKEQRSATLGAVSKISVSTSNFILMQQKNKTLLAHFKREARSIQKSKAKADKDLKAYSSFLKANKK